MARQFNAPSCQQAQKSASRGRGSLTGKCYHVKCQTTSLTLSVLSHLWHNRMSTWLAHSHLSHWVDFLELFWEYRRTPTRGLLLSTYMYSGTCTWLYKRTSPSRVSFDHSSIDVFIGVPGKSLSKGSRKAGPCERAQLLIKWISVTFISAEKSYMKLHVYLHDCVTVYINTKSTSPSFPTAAYF